MDQTPTSTKTLTVTPRPTGTARVVSPTPTPFHFEVPDWLADPEALVLVDQTCTEWDCRTGPSLSFINVSTGERRDIDIDDNYDVTWGIDSSQGQYLDLISEDPRWGQARDIRVYVTGNTEILARYRGRDEWSLAPGGRHVAIPFYQAGEYVVVIKEAESGRAMVIDNPCDELYRGYIGLRWSPAGDLLALTNLQIWQDYTPPNTCLSVYTPDGRLYRMHSQAGNVEWAPDNSYRMLVDITPYKGEPRPCILELRQMELRCLTEVEEWAVEHHVEVSVAGWSPDAQRVAFSYWNYGEEVRSGVCILEPASGVISCPIDNGVIGEGMYASAPIFSPDGRALAFVVNIYPPGGDGPSPAQIATAAIDGSEYHVWGYTTHRHGWRPRLDE